ncbi:MAG TPA: NMD3-related protein [Candidatus Thermoplasmatota archaeon]|nr:NMD3-related protein [Candidatus Thermoplasmatota archaeon]
MSDAPRRSTIPCVACGQAVSEDLVDGLCRACFVLKNRFSAMPQNVDLEVCVHCGARKRGEIWVDDTLPYEATIEAAVEEAVSVDRRVKAAAVDVELKGEDQRNFLATVKVAGSAEGIAFEEIHTPRARVKNATCLRCSRIQGGYYEAVIQLRAEDRDIDDEELARARAVASRAIERIVGDGDRNAFVLKDEFHHGGLDVYVGTINAARILAKALSNEMGGRQRESAKLVGQKDGRDIFRLTFLVKIPSYRVGDFVLVAERPHLVTAIQQKRVSLGDPVTGAIHSRERDDLERVTVLARREAREAVVVSATGSELQLLDPWTYATVSVLRPSFFAGETPATVHVARHEGELFVFPPRAS